MGRGDSSRFRNADVIEDPIYYAAQGEITAVAATGHSGRWLRRSGWGRVR